MLFVGTKKQAQDVIREEATRCGQYFVTNRWLGGTLTNFHTVKGSLERLQPIEKMSTDGTFERITKKEIIQLTREREKLEKSLGGIKRWASCRAWCSSSTWTRSTSRSARRASSRFRSSRSADTNCNPDVIDYVIPGNDDAIRSIKLFAGKVADACILGQKSQRERATQAAVARATATSGEAQTIHVSSGGEGPRVEMVDARRARACPTPEAAATPEDEEEDKA